MKRKPLTDSRVLAALAETRFWTEYFYLTEDDTRFPELRNCSIDIDVSVDCSLLLAIDTRPMVQTLYLATPSLRKPVQLGWNDQAHPVADVFRWEELEGTCLALSNRHRELVHPGIPLLLLCLFTPLVPSHSHAARRNEIALAAKRVAKFSDSQFQSLCDELIDTDRQRDMRWRRSERGWVIDGEDAYSLRNNGNTKFPFAAIEALAPQEST
jgi:hypothetical protein